MYPWKNRFNTETFTIGHQLQIYKKGLFDLCALPQHLIENRVMTRKTQMQLFIRHTTGIQASSLRQQLCTSIVGTLVWRDALSCIFATKQHLFLSCLQCIVLLSWKAAVWGQYEEGWLTRQFCCDRQIWSQLQWKKCYQSTRCKINYFKYSASVWTSEK